MPNNNTTANVQATHILGPALAALLRGVLSRPAGKSKKTATRYAKHLEKLAGVGCEIGNVNGTA